MGIPISDKTTIILLCILVLGLIALNITCWIGKKRNFTSRINDYNYDYVGVNKNAPRCNCQGSSVASTRGGNVKFMNLSPLNPGVGI